MKQFGKIILLVIFDIVISAAIYFGAYFLLSVNGTFSEGFITRIPILVGIKIAVYAIFSLYVLNRDRSIILEIAAVVVANVAAFVVGRFLLSIEAPIVFYGVVFALDLSVELISRSIMVTGDEDDYDDDEEYDEDYDEDDTDYEDDEYDEEDDDEYQDYTDNDETTVIQQLKMERSKSLSENDQDKAARSEEDIFFDDDLFNDDDFDLEEDTESDEDLEMFNSENEDIGIADMDIFGEDDVDFDDLTSSLGEIIEDVYKVSDEKDADNEQEEESVDILEENDLTDETELQDEDDLTEKMEIQEKQEENNLTDEIEIQDENIDTLSEVDRFGTAAAVALGAGEIAAPVLGAAAIGSLIGNNNSFVDDEQIKFDQEKAKLLEEHKRKDEEIRRLEEQLKKSEEAAANESAKLLEEQQKIEEAKRMEEQKIKDEEIRLLEEQLKKEAELRAVEEKIRQEEHDKLIEEQNKILEEKERQEAKIREDAMKRISILENSLKQREAELKEFEQKWIAMSNQAQQYQAQAQYEAQVKAEAEKLALQMQEEAQSNTEETHYEGRDPEVKNTDEVLMNMKKTEILDNILSDIKTMYGSLSDRTKAVQDKEYDLMVKLYELQEKEKYLLDLQGRRRAEEKAILKSSNSQARAEDKRKKRTPFDKDAYYKALDDEHAPSKPKKERKSKKKAEQPRAAAANVNQVHVMGNAPFMTPGIPGGVSVNPQPAANPYIVQPAANVNPAPVYNTGVIPNINSQMTGQIPNVNGYIQPQMTVPNQFNTGTLPNLNGYVPNPTGYNTVNNTPVQHVVPNMYTAPIPNMNQVQTNINNNDNDSQLPDDDLLGLSDMIDKL